MLVEYIRGQYADLVRRDGDAYSSEICVTCGDAVGYAASAARKGDGATVHVIWDSFRAGYLVDCRTGNSFPTPRS